MKRAPHSAVHASTSHREASAPRERMSFTNFWRTESFWSVFCALFLLIFAILAGVAVRQSSVHMDVANDWAASSIQQQVLGYFQQQVRSEYPLLADAQVNQRAQELWDKYQADNKDSLATQQAQFAEQLRANYQYEAKRADGSTYQQTYIFEMDPYYFLQKGTNYALTGSVCEPGSDVLSDGNCRDAKRLAPVGTHEDLNLHVFLEGLLIRFARSRGTTDPITAVFFLPVILMALAAIPAFFIARRFAGNTGGFVAAMILVLHPVILNRTVAGWVDTDAYAVLFPLLIIWLAIEAVEASRWWTRLLFAALAGIVTGIYSTAWAGWWFMLFVVTACFAVLLLYEFLLIVRKARMRSKGAYDALVPTAAIFGTFLVAGAIATAVVSGLSTFFHAFLQPFALSSGLQAATSAGNQGWPNILTTVAELNVPSMAGIIQNFSGGFTLVVILAAFGLFAILFNPTKLTWRSLIVAAVALLYYFVLFTQALGLNRYVFLLLFALPLALVVLYNFILDMDLELHGSVLILGWLLATFFAATQGIRFVLLGVPPFAIGFGIAVGWIVIVISTALTSSRPRWRLPIHGLICLLAILIVFNPVAAYNPYRTAEAVGRQQAPGINDAWWESMRFLREDTSTDTIVTSWWDFGHWFRNIGNRSVTFDGGSQNPEPGHWVGKSLLTSSEAESVGILRMLNCGQNGAYDVAAPSLGVIQAKDLVDHIIVLDRNGAKTELAKTSLSEADQAKMLELTHCEPRSQVFITSADMVGKAGVWGHFGGWDFRRSMASLWAKQLPADEAIAKLQAAGMSAPEATTLVYEARKLTTDSQTNTWISGWPGYLTSFVRCTVATTNETERIVCPFNVGVGQTSQGIYAVETVSFVLDRPADAAAQIGVYQSGQRLGGTITRLPRVVIADRGTQTIRAQSTNATDVSVGMLVRVTPGTNGTEAVYEALLADPLQLDSMYTKLYYLNGEFTESFTPISRTTEIGGGVVTIWNVTWPQD